MRNKRILFFTALFVMLFNICVLAASISTVKLNLTYDGKTVEYKALEVKVNVDGKELQNLDMPAVIIEDRTLVPLRAIFEAMGAEVDWDGAHQKITAEFDNDTIIMFVNNKSGMINNNSFSMDVAPKIINDRTMVPVRAIAEAVGAKVNWDKTTRVVSISSDDSNAGVIGSDDTADDSMNYPDEETIIIDESQKVTDLSNVLTSEIDREYLENENNEINVTAVTINGNDSYTIRTSGKIQQYKYATVLGKKVAVDIYGSNLAVSATSIPVNDAPVEKIRIAQNAVEPYKIVRVVFDLTETAGEYTVAKTADGTSIIVNFGKAQAVKPAVTDKPDEIIKDDENKDVPVIGEETEDISDNDELLDKYNTVNEIHHRESSDSDIITVSGDKKLKYDIFTLSNPYRIIVEIEEAVNAIEEIPDCDDMLFVENIRVTKINDKKMWVLLEVEEGAEFKSTTGDDFVRLNITKSEDAELSEGLINDGKTLRFAKARGMRASNMSKNYDPYTGNTIISLGGNYGSDYGNKTLTYYNENPEASYIASASFSSSGGVTNIIITPSLIAEFNIYENGDYIYIDLVDPKTVYDTVVIIDAGHGGTMPGAVVNGVYEKNITLDIAKRVYSQLNGGNIKVYVTRFTDTYVDNYKRAYMANFGADIFVSIHCNSISGNKATYGTETLYAPHAGEGDGGLTSYILADELQKQIVKLVGTYDRGVKVRPELIVLKNTTVPAALVETGFMTDANDMALITSDMGRQKFANAITQAVKEIAAKYDFR